MQSHRTSRGTLRTVLLAVAAIVGITFIVLLVLAGGLVGGSGVDEASTTGASSLGSTNPQVTLASLQEREDPWPAGVVAEMIVAADPALSLQFRTAYITQCMANQGLDYIGDIEPAPFYTDRLDRDSVALLGFGIGIDSPAETVTMSPNNALLELMAPADADAWSLAQDNCVNEANLADQQVLEDNFDLLPVDLQQEIIELRFYQHPALAAALDMWSDCMLANGFEVPHPFVMIEDLAAGHADSTSNTATLQQHERQLALANYDCRYEFLAPAFDQELGVLEAKAAQVLQSTSLYQPALKALQQ